MRARIGESHRWLDGYDEDGSDAITVGGLVEAAQEHAKQLAGTLFLAYALFDDGRVTRTSVRE
jgi:hypothetical protein